MLGDLGLNAEYIYAVFFDHLSPVAGGGAEPPPPPPECLEIRKQFYQKYMTRYHDCDTRKHHV